MIFYYDETFHDRKITMLSNGYPNIYESNDNDSFVFAILGDRKEKMDKILLEYEKIEKLTKEKLQFIVFMTIYGKTLGRSETEAL